MVWASLGIGLLACAGDKDPAPTGATGDTGPAGPPTFDDVLEDVLRPSCALTGCHAATSVNGMALVPGEEYERLVNAPAEDAPGEVLVIPGDVDGSYVMKKLTGAPGIVGEPMPPPLGVMDPNAEADLAAWIEAGALDN